MGTIVVGGLLVVVLGFAVRSIVVGKKNGKSGCGGDCGRCNGCH